MNEPDLPWCGKEIVCFDKIKVTKGALRGSRIENERNRVAQDVINHRARALRDLGIEFELAVLASAWTLSKMRLDGTTLALVRVNALHNHIYPNL